MANPRDLLPEDWIPYQLAETDGQFGCRWLYLDGIRFTSPFFSDSTGLCRRHPYNAGRFIALSRLEGLVEAARHVETLPPAAFIFHVSRCGSTLLTQLLSTDPANVVLSEPPLLDEILRLPYRSPALPADTVETILPAAIRLLGRRRQASEQRLFIKLDSWHVFFHATLRKLYPDTPFILLYRRPDEVLRSHRKQPGMQSVPGLIEPEVFGFDPADIAEIHPHAYFGRVLERYLEAFVRIRETDPLAFPVNYSAGREGLLQTISAATGLEFDAALQEKMAARSVFHAKRPHQVFETEEPEEMPAELLEKAFEWYLKLESNGS